LCARERRKARARARGREREGGESEREREGGGRFGMQRKRKRERKRERGPWMTPDTHVRGRAGAHTQDAAGVGREGRVATCLTSRHPYPPSARAYCQRCMDISIYLPICIFGICVSYCQWCIYIIIHTMSHHHTYYVTSSYILCHIIIHTMSRFLLPMVHIHVSIYLSACI